MNNCIDASVIRIVHNMIHNNMEKLGGAQYK